MRRVRTTWEKVEEILGGVSLIGLLPKWNRTISGHSV